MKKWTIPNPKWLLGWDGDDEVELMREFVKANIFVEVKKKEIEMYRKVYIGFDFVKEM